MGGTLKARPAGGGLLFPGAEDWEFWVYSAKAPPRPAAREEFLKAGPAVAALPTRNFLVYPFWMPPQADIRQLCELEFSSRHLVRRGQPVEAIEIERQPDRVLVLGVAPCDDPGLPPEFGRAPRIELPARLWNAGEFPALVWREFGTVCFAFRRATQTVFCSASAESFIGIELAHHIVRCAQRLEAEDILEGLPGAFLLIGPFDESEAAALGEAAGAEVQLAPEGVVPALVDTGADFPPPAIRAARANRERAKKRLALVAAAAVVYLGIVAGMAGVLILGEQKVRRARAGALALEPGAIAAKEAVTRWSILRPAIDPGSFTLDLLAAVAAALPSESVRYTRCAIGGGRIELAGEAADVSQTYELLEKLKNSPALLEYEWVAAPPEIAGREIVRFDIQGRRPDARTDTN